MILPFILNDLDSLYLDFFSRDTQIFIGYASIGSNKTILQLKSHKTIKHKVLASTNYGRSSLQDGKFGRKKLPPKREKFNKLNEKNVFLEMNQIFISLAGSIYESLV